MRGQPLRDRPAGPEEERLFDLMRERAVFGLEDDELRELNRLSAAHADVDIECYDRAAAALDLAWSQGRCARMPAELARTIAAQAPRGARQRAAPPRPQPARWTQWSGWVAAAAATIVAVLGWTRTPPAPTQDQAVGALQRDVDRASDHIVLSWKPTEDPDGRNVSGELHWSSALQKGYMRFRGLPRNDPGAKQYQLWIFDKPRGTEHPVDGGVFDVARADEAVVPIDAKIKVFDPAMFAVTVEPPGGVVVSKREHIVSLAQL